MVPGQFASAIADRYLIQRELGRGGTASVFLAEDLRHRRQVAVKVLRPEYTPTMAQERFLREIATVARLQHPHIVPLLDSGQAAGYLYFVMPFVEGESLRERLRRESRLPIPEVLRILADVTDAVAHAHARGVVHRDIKPENILLAGRHAVVTDFGVARAMSVAAAEGEQLTTGVALGTPAYMSPEQAVASPDVDHRADIYALGVLGYELLAGQPPFTAATPQELLTKHVALQPEPLLSHREETPPGLAHAIMRCLEKRPEDRWQSAVELVDQLEPLTTPSGGVTPAALAPVTRASRWLMPLVAGLVIVAAAVSLLRFRSAPAAAAEVRQRQLTFLGNVADAAPSPDGQFLALALRDTVGHRIVVRDLLGGNEVPIGMLRSFLTLSWSGDGSQVYSQMAGAERTVVSIPRLGGPMRVLFPRLGMPSPDGRRVAHILSTRKRLLLFGPGQDDSTVIDLPFDYLWPLNPVWSPDGSRVALPLIRGDFRRSSIAIIPVDGSPPHEILADSLSVEGAVWAPDGKAIYFLREHGTVSSLFRQELDGEFRPRGNPVRLLDGLEPYASPPHGAARLALSSDGRRLVYVRSRTWSNIGRLAIGADPRLGFQPFTSGTADHRGGRLSRDDRRLMFFRSEPNGDNVILLRLDGGAPTSELSLMGSAYQVAWGRRDDAVAITGSDSGPIGIRIVTPGSAATRDFLVGTVGTELDWSPDGRLIYQASGNRRLGWLDPATGEQGILPQPDGEGWAFSPRVSPDGRQLAFFWNREGVAGLWLAALGGDSSAVQVASGTIRPIRWSPDGTRLWAGEMMPGDNRIRLLEVRIPGGTTRPLTMLPAGFDITDLTSDARTLMVTQRELQSDAWLIELPPR
ncbi:MAG TPA: protein kinase [Gemmatimonadales bacterium]|nr:protein kinase [Gemmatimonadales bacterium]